jgi:hypothetical protein
MLTILTAVSAMGYVPDPLDFKLTRGIGAHGYTSTRLTVITSAADAGIVDPIDPGLFSYNAAFKHRWTDKTLHTTLVPNVTAGVPTVAKVGRNKSITINLPIEGSGVRGVFIGDPCTEPGFVGR